MPAEHIGLDGKLKWGYFCNHCGKTCNMYGTGHGPGLCPPAPREDIKKLWELNK